MADDLNFSRDNRMSEEETELNERGAGRTTSDIDDERRKGFIEKNFSEVRCVKPVKSDIDASKCSCGQDLDKHVTPVQPVDEGTCRTWSCKENTEMKPTQCYGTIEFEGGPHVLKAYYARVAYDSDPSNLLGLLKDAWRAGEPRLLISVHGGVNDFNVSPEFLSTFRAGIQRAARTAGAWVVSSGLNGGVGLHVASGLSDTFGRKSKKIVAIGIAPWGLLKGKDDFMNQGRNATVHYHPKSLLPEAPKVILNDKHTHFFLADNGTTGRLDVILNDKHTHFFLADNGTTGRYGADIVLRQSLEGYISKLKYPETHRKVPVVAILLDGGTSQICAMKDYLSGKNGNPLVPVVICNGTGGAANILSWAVQNCNEDGSMSRENEQKLSAVIRTEFKDAIGQPDERQIKDQILRCTKMRRMITIQGTTDDLDHAIVMALLKGQRPSLSASDQLILTLSWNRPDIARETLFVRGQDWAPAPLYNAMRQALIMDRLGFVQLLLENGVSMEKFLNLPSLEALYNASELQTERHETASLGIVRRMLSDLNIAHKGQATIKYKNVRCLLECLMGDGFRFRSEYRGTCISCCGGRRKNPRCHHDDEMCSPADGGEKQCFAYPFNELFLWCVLFRRQNMAMIMWQHGEEALPKALTAMKIYSSMAQLLRGDERYTAVVSELEKYSLEFSRKSLELLDMCFRKDDDDTFKLLTYELKQWGQETCLSLAVIASHMDFVAHPACQILLSDWWRGGLNIKKYIWVKVMTGLVLPVVIPMLEFKTRDELLLQAQTKAEVISGVNSLFRTPFRSVTTEALQPPSLSDSESESTLGLTRPPSLSDSESESTLGLTRTPRQGAGVEGRALYPRGIFPKNSTTELQHSTVVVVDRTRSTRQKALGFGNKFYEFYTAPITSFCSFVLGYLFFVLMYTFMVLIKTPARPKVPEYYVFSYHMASGFLLLIRFMKTDADSNRIKFRISLMQGWNCPSLLAVILFNVGFMLRWISADCVPYARVIYILVLVYWYMHSLNYMAVHPRMGPYIAMVGRMFVQMVYILVILCVFLVSCGIVTQAIIYDNLSDDWETVWRAVRNMFFYPYFMLYGEVFTDRLDSCTAKDEHCTVGHSLTVVVIAVYLVLANILLINLLIAAFNDVYHDVRAVSNQLWKFQQYKQVLEYQQMPMLPPPLSLLLSTWYIVRWFWSKGKIEDNKLKLFLSEDECEKIRDFEEDCLAELHKKWDMTKLLSDEEQIRKTVSRVERMEQMLQDMQQKLIALMNSVPGHLTTNSGREALSPGSPKNQDP